MNKKLYILLTLFCLGMMSCDNDDSATEFNLLNIIESTVDFGAVGGEGFINVENRNAEMKVSSNAEWCNIKSAVRGTIIFDVAQNNGITSRAAVINIDVAGETKQVCITQIGVVSQYDSNIFYSYSDNVAFAKTIKFNSTLPISVSISDDAKTWLSYAEAEGGYTFSSAANSTGSARMGKVTIKAGNASIDYYFLQYGIDDLYGTWNASYSDGEAAAKEVISITKGAEANGLKINMQLHRFSNIKAVYEGGAIKIPCGQLMGKVSIYYIFLGTEDASGDNLGLDESVTCQLSPYLNEKKQWGLTFVDNGSLNYPMTGIVFYAANDNGTIAGYWDLMYDLTLNKN